jgi:hypothetical protein
MVNSEITKVDDKHIKELKKDLTQKGGIILYHWNSCGHCRNFMPVWDRVTSFLHNYPSYKIEYDYMSQAPRYFGHITSFPRIVAYFNGEKHEYEGSRDPDSLTEFIKKTIPTTPSSSSSAVKQTKPKTVKKPKATKKEKK